MNTADLIKYIVPGKKGYLVGIGGVSMSPLAEVLNASGLLIEGSDINDSASVKHLRSLGIKINIGHFAENVREADFVVRTAAVHDDNPEIAEALALGIPVFERAQAWGFIMLSYKNALCISGTHGKTTTTSMCTHMLMAAKKDPTVMIGGTLPMLGAGHRVGKGDTIVLESCEYCNSFHSFFPTVAVVLNVEADHLDFFKDIDEIKASFRKFAASVPENGCIVANFDDCNTMESIAGIDRHILTFGFNDKADVHLSNLVSKGAHSEFDVIYKDNIYCHIILNLPGKHNISNALATAASAIALDIPGSAVAEGLAAFSGAGRRLEFKGEYNGAVIYDDYAHHPAEIHALIDAVSSLDYNRIIVAFQPHTYTRTKALFNDFVRELLRPDVVFLAEIYAAREKNTIGISSKDLADNIPNAVFCPTFDELEAKLRETAQPGDIIITVGAGNIYTVGEALIR